MGTVYIIKNKLDAAHPEVPKENLKKADESLSKGIEKEYFSRKYDAENLYKALHLGMIWGIRLLDMREKELCMRFCPVESGDVFLELMSRFTIKTCWEDLNITIRG